MYPRHIKSPFANVFAWHFRCVNLVWFAFWNI